MGNLKSNFIKLICAPEAKIRNMKTGVLDKNIAFLDKNSGQERMILLLSKWVMELI